MHYDAFNLLSPSIGIWLLVLPVAGIVLLAMERMRERRLKLLSSEVARGTLRSKTRRSRILLPLIMLTLFFAALARPYWGYEEHEIRVTGHDTLVVFDISSSMLTDDVHPSRLEFGKRKLLDAIDTVARNSPMDRLGIVLFAGESYLFCPLTSDYAVLRMFARSIDASLITSTGSALTSALETALDSFREAHVQSGSVVLMSDGEDQGFEIDDVLGKLKTAGIPVDAFGIGTPAGKPIPLSDGTFVRDDNGQVVISRLRADNLEKISQATGGKYLLARLDNQDNEVIFPRRAADASAAPGSSAPQTYFRVYHELGPLILWVPLLIFAVSTIRRSQVFLLLLLAPVLLSSTAFSQALSLRDSANAYENGDYDTAAKGFEGHVKDGEADRRALQGLASSLYKQKKYKEAQALFEKIPEIARAENAPGKDRFEAEYNLGNARFMTEGYKEAIESYENALKIKPDDEKAKYNLELAKKMLEEKKKQEEEKKKEQQDQRKDEKENKEEQEQKQNQDQQQQKDGQDKKPEDGQEQEKKQEEGKDQDQEKASPDEKSGQEEKQEGEEKAAKYDPKDLKEKEAEAWLDSLPEAPALLQRQRGRAKGGSGQSW